MIDHKIHYYGRMDFSRPRLQLNPGPKEHSGHILAGLDPKTASKESCEQAINLLLKTFSDPSEVLPKIQIQPASEFDGGNNAASLEGPLFITKGIDSAEQNAVKAFLTQLSGHVPQEQGHFRENIAYRLTFYGGLPAIASLCNLIAQQHGGDLLQQLSTLQNGTNINV